MSRSAPDLSKIPITVNSKLDDAGLSVHAFRVFGRVCRRWSAEDGCYESAANMAAACHMKRNTVFRALKELEERNMIRRTERPGETTRIDWVPIEEWVSDTEPVSPNGTGPDSTQPPKGDVPDGDPSPETARVPVSPNGTGPVSPNGTQREPTKGSNEGIPNPPQPPEGGSGPEDGTGDDGGGDDEPEGKKKAPSPRTADRFPDFWEVYPVKRKKKDALKKWKAKRLDAMADELIADVKNRMEHDDQWKRGFIPHPTTYLNGELWNDELTGPKRQAPTADDARNRPIDTFHRNRAAGLAALGVGPGGVGGPGDA